MAILTIKDLVKSYGGAQKAVDGLSLSVEPGDVYGFIGHNGAGKTTTLKAVTGILDYDSGEIQIDGYDVKAEPIECKRRIAYVPDNPELYDYLTGIQFLNFFADIYRVEKSEREDKIKKYADAFEITQDLGDLIGGYSHGMKQKLMLVASFMHDPKLFIFDEPFVGLDPKAAYSVKQLMREACERGAAVFFSTHVLDVAEKLCDKIAIIKKGKLIADGRIDAVRGDDSLEEVFLELVDKGESAL